MRRAWTVIRTVVARFFSDNVMRLSASLAFYTTFSLAPILVIVLAVVGTLWGEEAAEREIVEQIDHLVGEQGAEAVEIVIEKADRSPGKGPAWILGVVLLLFGATAVFAELQDALNIIWRVQARPGAGLIRDFVKKRLLSLGLVIALAFLLLVSLAVSAAVSFAVNSVRFDAPSADWIWAVVDLAVSLAAYWGIFAIVFKFLPDVQLRWRDVAVGAGVTAGLFALGKELIGLFLSRNATVSAYGAAGSLVVLLFWVYYSSLILFLGAEFTRVLTEREGREAPPESHAEPRRMPDPATS